LLLALALAGNAQAQRDEAAEDEAAQQKIASRVVTHGEVCPDPKSPCLDMDHFHENELSFRLKSKFDFDRRKAGFIAVYAGKTEAEAKQFLAEVKAAGRFPDANLRRMQVVLIRQLE